ncbi:MAG TPA: T9SS type A sorting domain-containing protein [Terriglobales bacterium]|nr:T9SS type A sorting domain-containing protein [Terriglobales bacterium]
MFSAKGFYFCLLILFLVAGLFLANQVTAAIHEVSIVDFAFNPSTTNAVAGDTVRWTNNSASNTHTSTSDSGVWDSGILTPGSSYMRQFSTPGTFPYHCAIHTFMVATVVVSPTEVGEGNSSGLPGDYSLDQNSPNPFNSSTRISFYLPKKDKVELDIYNILGQKIKTLLDKREEPGTKDLFWDGTDDKGLNVPSGIYFYRLTAQDFADTKKMVYLK